MCTAYRGGDDNSIFDKQQCEQQQKLQQESRQRKGIALVRSAYHINQKEPYHQLTKTVQKQYENFGVYQKKKILASHTVEAFHTAQQFINEFYRSHDHCSRREESKTVILDSGCGVGMSSIILAKNHPQYPVIGIDRSFVRLSKNHAYDSNKNHREEHHPPNLLLLRAELTDFWLKVALDSDWCIHSHYLLYPNPYPKNKHFKRRWHGHPTFTALLALGGTIIIRSNWVTYCEEFCMSLQALISLYKSCFVMKKSSKYIHHLKQLLKISDGHAMLSMKDVSVADYNSSSPMTHFERKFQAAGADLYQVEVPLIQRSHEERKDLLNQIITATTEETKSLMY